MQKHLETTTVTVPVPLHAWLRRGTLASLVFAVLLALPVAAQSPGSLRTQRFVGAWSLVSYELRLTSGEVLRPFGDHPVGRIVYQKGGQMSAQADESCTAFVRQHRSPQSHA